MSFPSLPWVLGGRLLGLLVVLGIASYYDWKIREVRDELWLVGGLVGGGLLIASSGTTNLALLGLYVLTTIFVLQHFVAWDARLESRPHLVLALEGGIYALVLGAAAVAFFDLQPAPPAEFYAVIVGVVLARILFETGLLYGGADAKAMMAASLLLPLGPMPLLATLPPSLQVPILQDIPFAFTMLVDGAVVTLAIPLVILGYNLSRGDARLPRALHLYRIPTKELPHRFVWLRDPPPPQHPREETTAEDEELRRQQAKELLEKGIDEVWVTPQLPFLIALAAGALIGVLFGDLLLWLISSFP
ncbi:MAG: prepilin peptidase [Euryarchaeota archaeon]|nr:prepilin peptidase [Euryarchaeota archaeon]MDE1838014.1 prepilin peptidase [Euryarchaeota archaeon]MDE1881771.1 prepilin peptidase [Euryarchaeota archaeon]MDE2046469.1 prepilin peptidase [Thermoplasmata archaeon]